MNVGTRGSQLALAQTNQVCKDLASITNENIDVNIIKTKGDKITNSQLYNMDAKGLFTKELDKALLEEEIDFAVHSFKDLPTELDEELEIAAVPKRVAPNEVLINKCFELKPIRGNIETRISKVNGSDLDATLMAQAGLIRLNLTQHIKTVFPLDYITPAAGQGALAIITRKDSDKKEIISKLNDYQSRQEVFAEKQVLEELGVGCQWPIGAIAQMKDKQFCIYSILLTKEGEVLKEHTEKGSIRDAVQFGKKIGKVFKDYV